ESVELVRRAKKSSAAGFVNAILRKVDRAEVAWPDRATALSHPGWLLDRWDRQFGRELTDRIALANLAAPETYVRVPGMELPAALSAELEPTDLPGCYRATGKETGGFRIQDIGSQSVVPHLRLEPGLTFLDLCAAPGNKTAQALESRVQAVAADLHLRR